MISCAIHPDGSGSRLTIACESSLPWGTLMRWRNSTDRYGSLSIGLHWLMLLLFVAVYACIELRGYFPKGSDPREALKTGTSCSA
jgi:hypothetical protein